MKKITVGLSKRTSFNIFSLGIELFQRTKYSHAYIKLHLDDINRDCIYQASGLAVNFSNMEKFDAVETVIHEWDIEVTDEMFNQIMGFCFDELGKPYDIKMIIGIIFNTLFGWKLFNSDGLNSFICSELVGYVLKMVGVLPLDHCLDYYTPKDVFNTLNNNSLVTPVIK